MSRGPIQHHATEIARDPARCWALFADLLAWPHWLPHLREVVALEGPPPFLVGSRFRLKLDAGPMAISISPTVKECEPARRVRWVGNALGIQADHVYTFEAIGDGATRMTSHEEFSGFAARLMTAGVRRRMGEEMETSLARFKALVEAQPPTHAG